MSSEQIEIHISGWGAIVLCFICIALSVLFDSIVCVVCFVIIEGSLLVYKMCEYVEDISRCKITRQKILECLQRVTVEENASIIDVSSRVMYNKRVQKVTYKYGNVGRFYKMVKLDDHRMASQRVNMAIRRALDSGGFKESLSALRDLYGDRHNLYPIVYDCMQIECTKEEYDAFDGTSTPTKVQLFPFVPPLYGALLP